MESGKDGIRDAKPKNAKGVISHNCKLHPFILIGHYIYMGQGRVNFISDLLAFSLTTRFTHVRVRMHSAPATWQVHLSVRCSGTSSDIQIDAMMLSAFKTSSLD